MLKQYVKLYKNPAGVIEHIATQDLPFATDYEPVGLGNQYTVEGFEIDVTEQDLDFGPGQKIVRAKELIGMLQSTDGVLSFTALASPALKDRVVALSEAKDVSEPAIKQELASAVVTKLNTSGETEAGLMALLKRPSSTKAVDLTALELIRIKKALGA